METHLFTTHKVYPVIMEATDRLILYIIPISLLIINMALSWAYTHHIKTLRDAVRTWDAITPSIPASRRSTLQTRASSVISPSNPMGAAPPLGAHGSLPPPYYEQQLPLNPNAPSIPNPVPEYEVQQDTESHRKLLKPGNRKCDSDNCVTCDLLLPGTSFRSTMTGKEYKFMPNVGCHTKNIIYLVSGFCFIFLTFFKVLI